MSRLFCGAGRAAPCLAPTFKGLARRVGNVVREAVRRRGELLQARQLRALGE
jgi:hypothetical protein